MGQAHAVPWCYVSDNLTQFREPWEVAAVPRVLHTSLSRGLEDFQVDIA
jgi:hypothetical protein